jgi:hypothetical protein
MNNKRIVSVICIVLVVFALFKVIASQLCAPSPNNVIVSSVSNAISTAPSSSAPAKPDPYHGSHSCKACSDFSLISARAKRHLY